MSHTPERSQHLVPMVVEQTPRGERAFDIYSRLLKEIAADYQSPDQSKQYYRGNPQLMQGLRAMVMEEQVVEALLAAAKAKDAPMSLDDLLKPTQQAS